MESEMKFVTFNGYNGEQIIVFPRKIQHLQFAESIERLSYGTMRPISGGFVKDGECVGESVSLGLESRGDADTALLSSLLNSKDC